MRLLDELIINGYYTTRVRIGTPPQEFALIVDTGSTITYVPCSTRSHCGRHQMELLIGRITFDMFLNMSCAGLKPHTNELRELIANELHINTSQEMDLSLDGPLIWLNLLNSSRMQLQWVSFLSEHGIHLPDNFRNYELVDYKIEPLATRRWWQRHQSALIVGVIIMLLLGLSASQ